MIVRQRPRFFELLFLLKGSILRRIVPQLITVFVFAVIVVIVESFWPEPFHSLVAAPFTLLGIAISVFLGFRNNACYDRWWEARRQLGEMVGEMRTLARLSTSLLRNHNVEQAVLRGLIGYTFALMSNLRGEPISNEAAAYLPEDLLSAVRASGNPPARILRAVSARYTEALQYRTLTDIEFLALENHMGAVANIQVACERIASTPTPFTYTLLLHRTAYLFCFLLPFSLAPTLGWATPIFCTLIAYTFFGLDALGDELEEPFGDHSNALPLNALARVIEVDLLEALDAEDLPPYLLPVDHDLR